MACCGHRCSVWEGPGKSIASAFTSRLLPLCRVVKQLLLGVCGLETHGVFSHMATWALWVLTGMAAGYPVAEDDVSSGGGHLRTLVVPSRWPTLTVAACCILLAVRSGGMGVIEVEAWG